MTKILIYIMLISIVLMILLSNTACSLTLDEEVKLKHKLEQTCIDYNKTCEVTFSTSDNVQAFTTPYNRIIITSGLSNKLNYDEVQAIGLHEVGHVALEHCKRHFEATYKLYPISKQQKIILYHTHEIEADLFATMIARKENMKNYLPIALEKIVSKYYRNKASSTHPSVNQRIKIMKSY